MMTPMSSSEDVDNSKSMEHINAGDTMSLTNNLQIELFDVWDINYMGPFPKSYY